MLFSENDGGLKNVLNTHWMGIFRKKSKNLFKIVDKFNFFSYIC